MKVSAIIRTVLGLLILISGANKFGHWINVEYMHDAMQFVIKLSNIGAGFAIYAIGILEIAIGLALIINRFSVLATLALLPLIVSILVFHIFLDLKGIGVAVVVFAMNLYMLYVYKDKVSGIFKLKEV